MGSARTAGQGGGSKKKEEFEYTKTLFNKCVRKKENKKNRLLQKLLNVF